jgi:RNA polymerase sigma-70 factor (ECF subfamily)
MERSADDRAAERRGVEETDGELVQRSIDGNRRAFDVLIARYQRRALSVSLRLLGNVQDAQEVTQDAFLKSFTSLATLQQPDAFGGWLLRIVSNLSLNYRRRRKSRPQVSLDEIGADPLPAATPGGGNLGSGPTVQPNPAAETDDPLRRAQGKELGARLQTALAQLPERQRLAILMFTIDQLPQKDIAAALGCTVEAVKWHVFQGRKRLKTILKEYI